MRPTVLGHFVQEGPQHVVVVTQKFQAIKHKVVILPRHLSLSTKRMSETSKSLCKESETPDKPEKGKGGRKEEEAVEGKKKKEDCSHPRTHVVQGANQYGRWERCLRCQTKIMYVPHSRRQPTKKEKGYVTEYVKTPADVEVEKDKKKKSPEETASSSIESAAKFQETLMESNAQLLQGMSHIMARWCRDSRP